MSITEELREFIDSLACHKDTRDMMRRIADRIDKEHAEAVADALQLRGEPDRWVELPVDADGIPIHMGDVMTDGENAPDAVRSFLLDERGWYCKGSGPRFVAPTSLRHVKPDSWERIIKDALIADRGDAYAVSAGMMRELVERCRRLAGDGK